MYTNKIIIQGLQYVMDGDPDLSRWRNLEELPIAGWFHLAKKLVKLQPVTEFGIEMFAYANMRAISPGVVTRVDSHGRKLLFPDGSTYTRRDLSANDPSVVIA